MTVSILKTDPGHPVMSTQVISHMGVSTENGDQSLAKPRDYNSAKMISWVNTCFLTTKKNNSKFQFSSKT